MKWFLVRTMSNRYVQAFISNPTTIDLTAFTLSLLWR